jgi:branched-chain amino acid transport system permease protein
MMPAPTASPVAAVLPRRSALSLRLATELVILCLLVAAPLLGLPPYFASLAIEIFLFSILAMSLDLLLGYTGLVSLGHAAFFAAGAYATGIVANQLTPELWVTIPAGIAVAACLAVPVAWLSIRLSGFYFLMITFAFAEMIYSVAFRWKWLTGGSDGLLVNGPSLFGEAVLTSRTANYYFALSLFVLSWLILHLIVRSPFGHALTGIRENTRRMRAIGYDVRSLKMRAFIVAAGFAGLAGAINAEFNLFVAPDAAHWTQSASILIMVLIGGAGTLVGPVIGAAIVMLLQNWISSYTQYWNLILGLLFIVLITWARHGLYGLWLQLLDRIYWGRR